MSNEAQTTFTIRLATPLYETLKIRSLIEDVSMNDLIVSALRNDPDNSNENIEAIRRLVKDVRTNGSSDEQARRLSSRYGAGSPNE